VSNPNEPNPKRGPKAWINLSSGTQFFPLDPDSESIRLSDITKGLSNLCRFGGQVDAFYSVAQHSILVSYIVEKLGGSVDEIAAALLHDAPEGLGLIDLPRPVKHQPALAAYCEAEAVLAAAVAKRFGLETIEPEIVKRVDVQYMVPLEAERLFTNKHPDWFVHAVEIPDEVRKEFGDRFFFPLSPNEAFHRFEHRARQVFGTDAFEVYG